MWEWFDQVRGILFVLWGFLSMGCVCPSLISHILTGVIGYLFNLPKEFGFGSKSTGKEIVTKYHLNLQNKTIIITGCNSGLGLANLEAFLHVCDLNDDSISNYNLKIIMACRNVKKANDVAMMLLSKYSDAYDDDDDDGDDMSTSTKKQQTKKKKTKSKIQSFSNLDSSNNSFLNFENKIKFPKNVQLIIIKCDLNNLKSINNFYQTLTNVYNINAINILINNAGIAFVEQNSTVNGIEQQFGVNYIGHYYLTQLLLPLLVSSVVSNSLEKARIVNVSSVSAWFIDGRSRPIWSNVMKYHTNPNYNPFVAYGYSKLALILHGRFFTSNNKHRNKISINSCHPGCIVDTSILRDVVDMDFASSNQLIKDKISKDNGIDQNQLQASGGGGDIVIATILEIGGWIVTAVLHGFEKTFLKTVQQGASTQVLLAIGTELEGISGQYFEDCSISVMSNRSGDDKLAQELMQFSDKLLIDKLKT